MSWITIYSCAALLCILILFVILGWRLVKGQGKSKMSLVMLCLLPGIFFARLAVHLHMSFDSAVWWDMLGHAIIDTLMVFGLGADYPMMIAQSRGVFLYCFNGNASALFHFCTILLYAVAPMATWAVVLDLLAKVFPVIKLWFLNLVFFKDIIYINCLNEESLAFATSLREQSNLFQRPFIVFTDIGSEQKQKETRKLLQAAENIKAVCLEGDILHIALRILGRKKFILIDIENEIHNLQDLTSLSKKLESGKVKRKNTEFYLFSNDVAYAMVAEHINSRLNPQKDKGKISYQPSEHPHRYRIHCFIEDCLKKMKGFFVKDSRVITVNGYRNLVRTLLYDLPLYEPFVTKNPPSLDDVDETTDGRKQLNLTVFGVGEIGTELFLSAYWYGQIYGYELCINVISKEPFSYFYNKINCLNPEIFHTGVYVAIDSKYDNDQATFASGIFSSDGKTAEYGNVMRIYPDSDEVSEPYFCLRYYQRDINADSFHELLSTPFWQNDPFSLDQSDYFAVTLGSDHDNLLAAEKLKNALSNIKLHSEQKNNNAVITYAIYDSVLCEALNEQFKKNFDASQTTYSDVPSTIYMHAFASLEEVYHEKNIFMTRQRKKASADREKYQQHKQKVILDKSYKTQYDFWANVTRVNHIKYKMFADGIVNDSVFTRTRLMSDADYNQYYPLFNGYYGDNATASEQRKNKLSWMEHRRWAAFMRVNGITHPDNFVTYCCQRPPEDWEHKSLELRLHPCLVECDQKGKRENLFDNPPPSGLDRLDCLSLDVYERCYREKEKLERKKVQKQLEEVDILMPSFLGRRVLKHRLFPGKKLSKKEFLERLQEHRKSLREKTQPGIRKSDFKKYDYPYYDTSK